MLSKQWAIEALQAGKKVTHNFFMQGEYVFMQNDMIFGEDGCRLSNFWELRSEPKWDMGWSEYVPTNF